MEKDLLLYTGDILLLVYEIASSRKYCGPRNDIKNGHCEGAKGDRDRHEWRKCRKCIEHYFLLAILWYQCFKVSRDQVNFQVHPGSRLVTGNNCFLQCMGNDIDRKSSC